MWRGSKGASWVDDEGVVTETGEGVVQTTFYSAVLLVVVSFPRLLPRDVDLLIVVHGCSSKYSGLVLRQGWFRMVGVSGEWPACAKPAGVVDCFPSESIPGSRLLWFAPWVSEGSSIEGLIQSRSAAGVCFLFSVVLGILRKSASQRHGCRPSAQKEPVGASY